MDASERGKCEVPGIVFILCSTDKIPHLRPHHNKPNV